MNVKLAQIIFPTLVAVHFLLLASHAPCGSVWVNPWSRMSVGAGVISSPLLSHPPPPTGPAASTVFQIWVLIIAQCHPMARRTLFCCVLFAKESIVNNKPCNNWKMSHHALRTSSSMLYEKIEWKQFWPNRIYKDVLQACVWNILQNAITSTINFIG